MLFDRKKILLNVIMLKLLKIKYKKENKEKKFSLFQDFDKVIFVFEIMCIIFCLN